jgi:hypothetical protein
MSSAQERNIRFYEAGYLNALKKGLEDKSSQVHESSYDYQGQDNSSSSNSDDEIQTRSKTAKKTARRNARIAAKTAGKQQQQQQQQQHNNAVVAPVQQESSVSPTVVEKKQKKLTKRQKVLQRYAEDEAAAAKAGAASVLASIADAAVTRSQARNRNTVVWTEKDRAFASRAAYIAVEVATAAAEAAQGKKKKEQSAPHWTRLHEKSRSTVRFQKEIGRVMECDDFECDFY